ncbi:MAG: M20/M25/M40 family metallo-hydrolase [Anaerolineales bacterium]
MLLQQLSDARGVSGHELEVRALIAEAVHGLVDEQHTDVLGNLICLRRARRPVQGQALRVMVAAHMDEIGFLATGINKDGTVRFGKVGGIDDRILLSKQVVIGESAVPGVIGYRPIHLLSAKERRSAPDLSHAAIDIGATSKEAAEKLVKLGDQITFRTSFQPLEPGAQRCVKGKALDDRAGCATLVELLGHDYAIDLYAVFTTQEEVGLRGAKVAASAIAPDLAFVLEGTICDDLPKKEDLSHVTELGKGPAITFMDRSFIADRRLVDLLVKTAQAESIPYQFKKAAAGGTDAGAIQLSREGVPAVTVAVPCRNIHAPVSILSLNDLDNTVKLMVAALQRLEGSL